MKTRSLIKGLLAILAVTPFGLQAQLADWPTPDFLVADDGTAPNVYPVFVRPGLTTGNSTGLTWDDAFPSITDATAVLQTGGDFGPEDYVQLIVEGGTTSNVDGITFPDTIQLLDANSGSPVGEVMLVAVRGGYSVNDDGDFIRTSAETILSGQNLRQAVRIQSARAQPLLLENITIANGNATAAAGGEGGGLFIEATAQTALLHLHRVKFSENRAAERGGALFIAGRVPATGELSQRPVIISDSLFVLNNAENTGGGAIWNELGHRNFTGENNSIYDPTGRVFRTDLLPDDEVPVGGAYLLVLQSTFDQNGTSQGQGGAIFNTQDGTMVLQSNVFWANNSSQQGGAIYGADFSYSTVVNNHFVRNRSTLQGPAIYLAQDAFIPLRQHVFGIAVTATNPGDPHIWNNFFFGNFSTVETDQVAQPGGAALAGYLTQRNLVVDRDGNEAEFFTNANIGGNPLGAASVVAVRGPDGRLGTADDGLYPLATSSLFDAGIEANVVFSGARFGYGPFGERSEIIYDRAVLAGTLAPTLKPSNLALDVTTVSSISGRAGLAPRVAGSQVEIGAYELQVAPPPPRPVAKVIYVDDNAPGDENGVHDGNTWESAYLFLQDALLRAHIDNDVNEIWVAEAENQEKWNVITVDGQWETENPLFKATGRQRLDSPARRDEIPSWKQVFDGRTAYNPGRPTTLTVSVQTEPHSSSTSHFVSSYSDYQIPYVLDRRPSFKPENSPRTIKGEEYPTVSYFTRDRYQEMRAFMGQQIDITYVRVKDDANPVGFTTRRVIRYEPRTVWYPSFDMSGNLFSRFGSGSIGIGPNYTFPVMPTQDNRRIMVYGGFQGWRLSAATITGANSGNGTEVPWVVDATGSVVEQHEVTWRVVPDENSSRSWTVAAGAREAYLVEQDTLTYETVLSGDLDISRYMIQNKLDGRHSYTVVTVMSDVNQLHEFTLFNTSADPRFVGSMLVAGDAYEGPAHSYNGATLTFDDNTFMVRADDNRSILDGLWVVDGVNRSDGAGIRISDSYILLNDIVVANNRAASGAGIYIDTFSTVIEPIISNSTFMNNLARNYGGAIYLEELADADIFNSNFLENEGKFGGGAIAFASGTNKTMVDRSVFANNRSDNDGGAVHLDDTDGLGDLVFSQCLFTGNYAGSTGGAIYAWYSDANVFNSVFSQNIASASPAIYNYGIMSLVGVIVDGNDVYDPMPISQIGGMDPYVAPTWFSVITGEFATGVQAMNATIVDGPPMFDAINLVSLIPGAPFTDALEAVIGFRDLNAAKTKVDGMPRDRVFGGADDALGFQLTDGSVAVGTGFGGRDAGIYVSTGLTGGVVEAPAAATILDGVMIGGGWYYSPLLGDFFYADGNWAYSSKYAWLYVSSEDADGALVWEWSEGVWWGIYGNFASDGFAFNFNADQWAILPPYGMLSSF